MNLDSVTPLILTFNEAPNIGDTLSRLSWAQRVIVVDSFSTDETVDIVRRFGNARIVQRAFDHFADQCNFGLSQIDTEWTLSLDADYKCSQSFVDEIAAVSENAVNGYQTSFQYCVYGKPLHATLYPARTVLYRTKLAQYARDGHAHRVCVPGEVGKLKSRIQHDDHKRLNDWLDAQAKYAALEADKLRKTPFADLRWKDRLRRCYLVAPILTFVYCLCGKWLIFDGCAGMHYTLQRVYAEWLLGLKLLDCKLRADAEKDDLRQEELCFSDHLNALAIEPKEYELSHPGN
jgi:hypothetical protein